MHPRRILRNLDYVNEVEAKRQTYYVFEGSQFYALLTKGRSKNSYHVNTVPAETVKHLRKAYGGRQKLTVTQVMSKSRRFSDRFATLSALYVLCALGEAKIDRRYHEKQLYFNISRGQV